MSRLRALGGGRVAALAALLAFALATVLLPWFALGGYVASGWDATWLARIALLLALVAALLLRTGGGRRARAAGLLAAAAALLVALRAVLPPDFGFGFDGLEVPTERRGGLWVALAAAVIAAAIPLARARRG